MKKLTIIFSVFVALVSVAALAAPYKPEDVKQIVKKNKIGEYVFDLKVLDAHIKNLMLHTANYPPKFDSESDKMQATKDIIFLTNMMETLVNDPKPDPEILWRVGLLCGLGYNLDLPGMSRTADAVFKKAVELEPEHMMANYHYGIFLAGKGNFKDAQTYLKRALARGHRDAEYSLGLTYLGLGNKAKALENLNSYQKKNPTKNISRMINAIEAEQTTILKK